MFLRARRARHTTGVPCSIVSEKPGVGLRHGGRQRLSGRSPWRTTLSADQAMLGSLHLQPQLPEGRMVYPSEVSPGPVRISTKDSADGAADGAAVFAGNGAPTTIDPVASRAAAALAIR